MALSPVTPSSPVPSSPLSSRRGFALLITITLLAFLVLLLVSLASLTRVETQVAGNNQQLAQARQNALLALNIALGQLQKYAGPDQRSTATADLAGGATGGRVASNSTPAIGPGKVQSGTRYWTGVWGNTLPATPAAGNGNAYEGSPRSVLLNWLVSGNESASYSASPAPATFGKINSRTGIVRTPADAASSLSTINSTASLLAAIDPAASSPLQVGGVNAMILVGPGTAGTAPRSVENTVDPATGAVTQGQTENFYDRYVLAPLQTITAPAGIVPGADPAQPSSVGHYAWWVGDEGVKARINLADTNGAHNSPASDPVALARLQTAPRSGAEIVIDRGGAAALADFGTASTAAHYLTWSQTDGIPSRILRLPQFTCLDSANLSASTLGRHTHDFTTSSAGLEVDSYNGGLRRDLTAYFSKSALPAWTGTNGADAGAGASIIPPAYSPYCNGTAYVPRWDVLYDFYNLYNTKQSSGAVPAQAASLTQMGLTPQILQIRIIVGVNATTGQNIKALFTPLVVMGNPYTVPLTITGLNLRFWMTNPPGAETWPNPKNRMISYAVGTSGSSAAGDRFMPLLTYQNDTLNTYGSAAGAVVFTLPSVTFQPGEAKIFSLSASSDLGAAALPSPSTVPLSEGTAATFASAYNHISKTSTWLSPPVGTTYFYKFTETDIFSPMTVEMRDSSGATVQSISGLTIDATTNSFGIYTEPNGATNTDRVIAAYTFDLSDPGADTAGGDTSIRLYTDFSQRAATNRFIYIPNTQSSFGDGNGTACGFYRNSPNLADLATANSTTPASPPTTFTSNLDPPQWGRHGSTLSPALYDLPRDATPVASLGRLQHANLTADDVALNVANQPALAVGNSYASIFLTRDKSVMPRIENYPSLSTSPASAYNATHNYYDLSYLLNTALWDGYFFSTIPAAGTPAPSNSRLALSPSATAAQARDGAQAASVLTINGAFNINSTSVDAWTALLAGMRNLPALPVDGATASTGTTIFPRSLRQPADSLTPGGASIPVQPSGDKADSYGGFRRLTDSQIAALATLIVKQVRLRGPFLSLSQFVNRALLPAASDTSGLGFSGALQTAIDSTTINDFADVPAPAPPTTPSDQLTTPAPNSNPFSYYAENPVTDFTTGAARVPRRSTGIPGWLTQADILQAIGPVLASRSDTFLVRTYGDVQNPATGSVVSRAWCEAIVQRLPDYVDAAGTPDASTAPVSATSLNQTFGRRFRVVGFRWLTPGDI